MKKLRPRCVSETLKYFRSKKTESILSNISTILSILMVIPATSTTVEKADSTLRLMKDQFCSKMVKDRLNSLVLFYINRDIFLDYDKITDMYDIEVSRKMLPMNLLDEN